MSELTEKKFEQLFKDLFKPLTAHAYKYLRDVEDAKEVVHQAFVKLWETRNTIDTDRNVRSYLYMTVTNLCLNYIRDNRKFVSTEDVFEHNISPENFNDLAARSELAEAMFKAIDELPEKMRQIFIMSRFDNLTYKEIAKKLNISVKTVENQISKALRRLRKQLKDWIKD